jgi:hypothetical protein
MPCPLRYPVQQLGAGADSLAPSWTWTCSTVTFAGLFHDVGSGPRAVCCVRARELTRLVEVLAATLESLLAIIARRLHSIEAPPLGPP